MSLPSFAARCASAVARSFQVNTGVYIMYVATRLTAGRSSVMPPATTGVASHEDSSASYAAATLLAMPSLVRNGQSVSEADAHHAKNRVSSSSNDSDWS